MYKKKEINSFLAYLTELPEHNPKVNHDVGRLMQWGCFLFYWWLRDGETNGALLRVIFILQKCKIKSLYFIHFAWMKQKRLDVDMLYLNVLSVGAMIAWVHCMLYQKKSQCVFICLLWEKHFGRRDIDKHNNIVFLYGGLLDNQPFCLHPAFCTLVNWDPLENKTIQWSLYPSLF